MQISLRSQMVAGTAAVVGASAIALTPIAPAANLPALNVSNAGVGLAAFANPITALANVGLLLADYTLDGVYSTDPASNWTNAGIGAIVNGLIPGFGVTRPGLIPNIITNPFPIAINLATNVLGYAYTGLQSVGTALVNLAEIAFLIPVTAVEVVLDIVTLNFENVITDIVAAFDTALGLGTDAINALIGGATQIVGDVIDNVTNVIDVIVTGIPTLIGAVTGQVGLLVETVTNVVNNVIAGFGSSNPIEGVWNALVGGLLDPTYGGPTDTLPGAVINLTYGAGIQPNVDPTSFVPSVRTALTGTIQGIADAIAGPTTPAPVAAAVEAPAVEVEAPVAGAEAPAAEVEAAPAAEATADDAAEVSSAVTARSSASKAAAEAPAAAPAAEATAGDSAPAAAEESSAPAKKPGRASARSAKAAAGA